MGYTIVLILSILLHDLGMYTNFSTFKAMIEGKYDDLLNENETFRNGNKRWSELWEEYLGEAKKFSGRQRKAIFGKEYINPSIPNLSDKDLIDNAQKKLIGEFIRRNHPRIAHEVALKGIINHKGEVLEFSPNLSSHIRKIAGIVARSHGIDLRETFEYLNVNFHAAWSRPDNVHIVFLMVVLRIADYFQFDNSRVEEKKILKLKTFSSPISEEEHLTHLSIDFVQESTLDPESYYVQAEPSNSRIYLKLQKLFENIQHELDTSWAVLGQIYGDKTAKNQPKIKFRRLDSNIEKKIYINKLPYVPENITFQSDIDLPKLLIAPLYGDNPTYGVRELLQNSVDACREREYEEKRKATDYNSRIEISIDKEDIKSYFIIKDNGKGMTLYELKNYFFKAGASYRKSLDWQKRFGDSDGNSQVQRSGRFGVGVLAAFLLGNEVEVWTKSSEDKNGYYFKAGVDTAQIEVKLDNIKEGTIIKIEVNEKTLNELYNNKTERQGKDVLFSNQKIPNWNNWYYLESPKIVYKNLTQKTNVKIPLIDEVRNDWKSIKCEKFNMVMWTYDIFEENYFFCNGFHIPRINTELSYPFNLPTVSVFDYDGNLPLNLNRNEINTTLPFENDLIEDISKDIIANLLCFNFEFNSNDELAISILKHPSIYNKYFFNKNKIIPLQTIIRNKDGYTLSYSYFLERLRHFTLLEIALISPENLIRIEDFYSPIFYSLKNFIFHIYSPIVERELIDDEQSDELKKNINLEKSIIQSKIDLIKMPGYYCCSNKMEAFESNNAKQDIYEVYNMINKRVELNENQFYDNKNRLDSSMLEDENDGINPYLKEYLKKIINSGQVYYIKECLIDKLIKFGANPYLHLFLPILDNLLKRYIGDNVLIPYSLIERKKKYLLAFDELKPYMQKYLNKNIS